MSKVFNVVKNGKVVKTGTKEACDFYVTFNANREGCKMVPADQK